MTEEKKKTMIDINVTTRDRLKKAGYMGDTYDFVINKLLDFWDKHKDLRE